MLSDVLKGFGIAAIILAVLAVIFELYLMQRYDRERERLLAEYGSERALCTRASDEILVYEHVPGACGANSQGYLDAERAFEKTAGTYRIVLIGDSVTVGQGVTREQRFGNQLQTELVARSGMAVEVVNLARSGYSTNQELEILRRSGLRYTPDLIVWAYVLNDPAHPIYHDANGELGRVFHRPAWRGFAYFARKAFEARERWLARDCAVEFHRLLHCAYWDEIERNLAAIADVAAPTPVVFAVIPLLMQSGSFQDYPDRDLHTRLEAIAQQRGFATVDLLAAFAERQPSSLALDSTRWFDPWHPNADGHALIAAALARHIETGIVD